MNFVQLGNSLKFNYYLIIANEISYILLLEWLTFI